MKLHPGISIIFFLMLLTTSLSISHPVFIVIWTAFIIGLITLFSAENKRGHLMYYFGFTAVMIILINPIVSQSGGTVLLLIRSVPLLGRIKITLEAIIFGVFMALKLGCASMSFLVFSRVTDMDDMFVFMSRIMPKSTILFSMTVNVFHRIREDITRIHDVMIMRGVVFDGGTGLTKVSGRIRSALPLLKVVVLSAMEGSLDRAEALHSRGFGEAKRSAYRPVVQTDTDRKIMVILFVLFIGIISSYFGSGTSYQFYPKLEPLLEFWQYQLVFFGITTAVYVALCSVIKKVKKWDK